jgi:hypothetical protein
MTQALSDYLERPLAEPGPGLQEAVRVAMDPSEALALSDIDRLLDPAPLAVETGWCWTAERVGYVAVRTAMPGTTAQMWDWWFDWHPREALRYQIWYPGAHFGNALTPPPQPRAKPFWGAIHHPDEDIGIGREVVRIAFLAPSEYGFSTDALDDPRVGTIVGGHTGSPSRHARVGVMTHVFLNAPDGLILRSRFWLGADARPDIRGPVGDVLAALINRPAVRRRLIPAALPAALTRHCAIEYTHLAAILPELYERYGN